MKTVEIYLHLGMEYTVKGSGVTEVYMPAPMDAAEFGTYTFCDNPGVSKPTRRPLDLLDAIPEAPTPHEERKTVDKF